MRLLPSRVQSSSVLFVDVFGTPHIGLFAVNSERLLILPPGLPPKKVELMASILGSDAVQTYISGSILIGPFICINSKGAVLPKIVLDEEISQIKAVASDLNIYIYRGRETAMGNLMSANDHCVVASPEIQASEVRAIADTLGVEAVSMSIAGRRHVGSLCLLTNRGGLVHVEATEEEVKTIEEYSRVRVLRATVNNGNLFVKSGVLANSKGALIGKRTVGPELMTISTALGL
ncbi:MAG: translation initiation factor IF-6 [Nitrososphaerota archaeon]